MRRLAVQACNTRLGRRNSGLQLRPEALELYPFFGGEDPFTSGVLGQEPKG